MILIHFLLFLIFPFLPNTKNIRHYLFLARIVSLSYKLTSSLFNTVSNLLALLAPPPAPAALLDDDEPFSIAAAVVDDVTEDNVFMDEVDDLRDN